MQHDSHFIMVKCDYMDKEDISGLLEKVILSEQLAGVLCFEFRVAGYCYSDSRTRRALRASEYACPHTRGLFVTKT